MEYLPIILAILVGLVFIITFGTMAIKGLE